MKLNKIKFKQFMIKALIIVVFNTIIATWLLWIVTHPAQCFTTMR